MQLSSNLRKCTRQFIVVTCIYTALVRMWHMQLMSASDLEDLEAKSSMLSCTGKRLTSLKGKMEINLREGEKRNRRSERVWAEFTQVSLRVLQDRSCGDCAYISVQWLSQWQLWEGAVQCAHQEQRRGRRWRTLKGKGVGSEVMHYYIIMQNLLILCA